MRLAVKKFLETIIPQKAWKKIFRASFQIVPNDYKARHGFISMWWSIENIKTLGYNPNTIIDVGAYEGVWTRNVAKIFPKANCLMVEAQPEKAKRLDNLATNNSNFYFSQCLAGSKDNEQKEFVVMKTGSSVYEQLHESRTDRKKVTLQSKTIDTVISEKGLKGEYFLKMDVQGYEIEVLKGATEVLKDTNVILLEASLLNYNEGAPLIDEIIRYLKGLGFVLFDICEFNRKSEDNVLNQADLIFCKENWTQRKKVNFLKT